MHEETLLRDLRAEIDRLGRRSAPARITGVDLWVGALSHVTEGTLRTRWPDVVAGSPAESAELRVEVSDDVTDPRARGVVLRSVRVVEAR